MRNLDKFLELTKTHSALESIPDISGWYSRKEPEIEHVTWVFSFRERLKEIRTENAQFSIHYAKPVIGVEMHDTTEKLRDSYLDQFLDAINNAKYILDLGDDWDEAGSKGYEQKTLNKTCEFLIKFVDFVHKRYSIEFEVPEVLPGPNGGIDIHWQTDRYELLIEIPEEDNYARYFGDNVEGEETKGKMKIDKPRINHGLLLWLTQ